MIKQIFNLLICFLLAINFVQAQDLNCLLVDHKGEYREQYVDFEKLILEISFDTKTSQVFGIANYSFRPLRTNVNNLFLDAPNIKIDTIFFNHQKIDFEYIDGGINLIFGNFLDWNTDYSLQIKYHTTPQKGIYFVGWNDPTQRALKQIWTQGQGIDNRHWIPGFDATNDKLISETKIRFETGYEVISNGVLQSKTAHKDNTTTWHYAMKKPHVLYLIMIAIGSYEYADYNSTTGIVSRQYFYPNKPEAEKPTYQYSSEMMDWFQKELGVTYQWEIYKNVPVRDFMYGAMENTSATIFTDYYLQSKREAIERNYTATNAHELAHHWFGDLISEWSGTHHWLHESFATHYSKHYMRSILGEDAYQWKKREEQRSALNAAKSNSLPIANTDAGSSRHYPKGSFVIDMLRYVVGEEEYKKTITAYLKKHSFDMVDTHDFQNAFMKTVGMNLDWFFNEWIYKGGEPHYQVDYSIKKKQSTFIVKQIHEQNDMVGLFKMPIIFQVHYTDGSFDEKMAWIENLEDTVIVKNIDSKKVAFVLFDPNSNVLKKVSIEKDYKQLLAQAQHAPNMIDRYDAVKAMKAIDIKKKRADLWALFELNNFRIIKQNILSQLQEDSHKKTLAIFEKALQDDNVNIRRSAIHFADYTQDKMSSAIEYRLKDESYVNIAIALKKLCKAYPDKTESYLNLCKNDAQENNILFLDWLMLASKNDSTALDKIVDMSSESYEFRTRIKAIGILKQKEYSNETYLVNLTNAYLSFNRRLSNAAKKHLDDLLLVAKNKTAVKKAVKAQTLLTHQKEKIQMLLAQFE